VARQQVALLRQDALKTTATFEQLLDTFQVAIAPGFAAGLNIDEIRRLSVSISQAATAIGLPQNQLAEEIRSLLSGTIQARTTRIATALQITNEDIRRLKETGELFDFLDERFKALGLASEQAARQTLSGISNLVRGAIGGVLGQAVEPLFQELIDLGNEFFDEVLTIRDAAGDIRPNPQAIAAFQSFFNSLKGIVEEVRILGREIGFEGAQAALSAIGNTLLLVTSFLSGFLRQIAGLAEIVIGIFRGIADILGIDVKGGLQDVSRLIGRIIADVVILNAGLRLVGFNLAGAFSAGGVRALGAEIGKIGTALKAGILTPLGAVGVAVAAVGVAFDKVTDSIFDVNTNIKETLNLLILGLKGALLSVEQQALETAVRIQFELKKALNPKDADILDLVADQAIQGIRIAFQGEQEKLTGEIAAITTAATTRFNESAGGFKKGLDESGESALRFASFISNAQSAISQAGESLGQLQQDLFKTNQEFESAGRARGFGGFAGQVESLFGEAAVQSAERLRSIQDALASAVRNRVEATRELGVSEERLAAIQAAVSSDVGQRDRNIRALRLTEEEGKIANILKDERVLQDAIVAGEESSLQLARAKAAVLAAQQLPALQRQNELARGQADAERATADALEQHVGARRLAVVQAQNELNLARQESEQRRRIAEQEIRFLVQQAAGGLRTRAATDDPVERARQTEQLAAIRDQIVGLQQQLDIENEIARAKERQLAFALRQAQLAEEGTFAAGVRAGFEQLADELPTLFEAARNIVTSVTQQLTSAISSAVIQAFDPRVQQDFATRVGELLLSIAQTLFDQALQSLIQGLIQGAVTEQTSAATAAATRTASATALITAAQTELALAQAAAAVRAAASVGGGGFSQGGIVKGFNQGGLVPKIERAATYAHRKAKGFARGGRPAGISHKDTVPAWLQPGEFVIRKAVVDSLGSGFFNAVNSGNFAAPPPAAAPSGEAGMATGGFVRDRTPTLNRVEAISDRQPVVVPVQVAGEREFDRLQAGGKNAMLRFMRENATTINNLLKR